MKVLFLFCNGYINVGHFLIRVCLVEPLKKTDLKLTMHLKMSILLCHLFYCVLRK